MKPLNPQGTVYLSIADDVKAEAWLKYYNAKQLSVLVDVRVLLSYCYMGL